MCANAEWVGGIETADGEVLDFKKPFVAGFRSMAGTVKDVLLEAKKAVKAQIEKVYSMEDSTVIDLVKSEYLHQAIEVVDLIRITAQVEEAQNNGLNGLKECLDQLNSKLEDLSKEALNELKPKNRRTLNAVMTLNIAYRNFLADVVIPSCEMYGFPLGFQ
jgi:hypothetical protein